MNAACFSLAGHNNTMQRSVSAIQPVLTVHPRRSPVDPYSLEEVSGSLYLQSLPAHSLLFSCLTAPCLSEPSEPHGQDQREQRYVPPPIRILTQSPPCSARQCLLPWGLALPACRAMPCGQAGGLLWPTSAGGSRMPCTVCKADCTKMFRSHQRRREKAWVVDRIHSGPAWAH